MLLLFMFEDLANNPSEEESPKSHAAPTIWGWIPKWFEASELPIKVFFSPLNSHLGITNHLLGHFVFLAPKSQGNLLTTS
jgi:hypothetical protein